MRHLVYLSITLCFAFLISCQEEEIEMIPPTVVSIDPTNNAESVSIMSSVTVTFSEAINQASVTSTSFVMRGSSVNIAGSLSVNESVVTFRPTAALDYSTNYTLVLGSGITDLVGNPLSSAISSFTTEEAPDEEAPTITSVDPADGAQSVDIGTTISITFSEAVNEQTVTGTTFTLDAGASLITGSFNVSTTGASFTPAVELDYSTTYTVKLNNNILDLAGNALVSFSSTFTTEEEPDTEAPTVISTNPSNNAIGVALDTDVTVTFSEDIDVSSVNSSNISYGNLSSATAVNFVSRSVDGNVVTISVDGGLTLGTEYRITVEDIRDLAGNVLDERYSFDFRTEAASNALPELFKGRWYNVAGTWIYGIDEDSNGAYVRTGNVLFYYDDQDVSSSNGVYRVNGTSSAGTSKSFWLIEQGNTNQNVIRISQTSASSNFTQYGKVVGETVTGALAENGIEFRKTGTTSWQERNNGSVTGTFTEYSRDEWSVYMQKTDGARIQIGCFRGIIRIQTSGDTQFRDLYDVAELYND